MDTDKIMQGAARMAANAKDGTLTVDGRRYEFKFNHTRWLYEVTCDGAPFYYTDLNTKSLKQARQWLRDYLAN